VISLAVSQDDCSVAIEFDLEAYRVLTASHTLRNLCVIGNGLPAKDDAIGVDSIRQHNINVIARASIGPQVVPQSGNQRETFKRLWRYQFLTRYCPRNVGIVRRYRYIKRPV
jgi:hypothetical protein